MRINKKIRIFLFLISLLYFVSLIQNTYAKYSTSTEASTDISIARWNILVNDQDIKNNSNFSNTIKPVFKGNEYIKDDIIAPTSSGYFDIVVNGENTDVSFKTTITIKTSDINTITDLQITGYSVDDSTEIKTLTNNTLEDTFNYNDTTKTKKYRFYVEWIDGENETMDNSLDTSSTTDGTAAFDININFIQIPKNN